MTRLVRRTFLLNVGFAFVVGCGATGPAARDAGDAGRARDGGSLDAETSPLSDAPAGEAGDAPDADGKGDSAPDASPDVVGASVPDAPTADLSVSEAGTDARDGSSATLSRAAACGRTWLWDWSTPGSARLSPIALTSGTPVIDTARDELLLPFDSQEFAIAVSASKYVLEFDLEIDGNLTFAVREFRDKDEFVPSITRSGGELILASVTPEGKTAPGGGFTGQRIPAERVHVTLFGDPYAHLLGMEVDSSHGSFWSGFAALVTPPQSLVLFGEDLSAERGTAARVHVGPMSGCDRPFNDDACKATPSPGFCPAITAPPL